MRGDRQSQVLLDNLSLGLLHIDDLYKKLEIQWINYFLMLYSVKLEDKWQSVWCCLQLRSVCAHKCA